MPPGRRLINRDRATATPSSTTTRVSLPPYEPPVIHHIHSHRLTNLPPNDASITSNLQSQIKDSSRNLGHTLGDVYERLQGQEDRLAKMQRRREEKGITEPSDEEVKVEQHLEKLKASIKELSRRSEQTMRNVVDLKAALEDDDAVMKDLEVEFSRRNRPQGPPEPEADQGPVVGPLATYNELRAGKREEYAAMTPHQRYALNNEYATFKKLWHTGIVGDDGAPLPDASRWFDARGEPVVFGERSRAANGVGGDGVEREGDEDEDDDIAVAREVISLKCPLTQQRMREPYSNRKCKHTFEREAIKQHISVSNSTQCPQTGCSVVFQRRDFNQDFYLDETMLRRIRRAGEAEKSGDYDTSRFDYDEDGDDDENLISDTSALPADEDEVPARSRAASRVPKRERMSQRLELEEI